MRHWLVIACIFLVGKVGATGHDTIQVRVTNLTLGNDTVYFVLEGRAKDTVNGSFAVSNLDVVFSYNPSLFNGMPSWLRLTGNDSPRNKMGQPISPYNKSITNGKFQADGKIVIGLGLPLIDNQYFNDSVMVFDGTWTQLGRYALFYFNDPQATHPDFTWITSAAGLTSEVYVTDSLNNSHEYPLEMLPFGDFPSTGIPFALKVFLDGPYNVSTGLMSTALNSGGHLPLSHPYAASPWNYAGTESVSAIPNANVVDWVLVEVRQAVNAATANGSTTKAKRAGFLLKDGSIVDLDGVSPLLFEDLELDNGLNTYTVVRHRNHLPIMSANPLALVNGSYTYDFSTSQTAAYGSANALRAFGNGSFGSFSGDADGNGQVQNTDKNATWTSSVGQSGYKSADFDLNGQVQNTDKNQKWVNNVGKGSQVPQ